MTGQRGATGPEGVINRVVFVGVVVAWTAIGEEFPAGGWRGWFGTEIMSMPAHYFYLAGTLVLLSPYLLATPRWSLVASLRELRLWRWLVAGWLALIISLAVAIVTAAPNPFADWRNLVLTGVIAALAGRWLASQRWRDRALTDLAIGYGLVSAIHLAGFFLGSGTAVFGIRTPTFYGPLLYMAVFSSIVLVLTWVTWARHPVSPIYGMAVRFGALASTLLVLLSFRRSFWLAWALGMVGVVFFMLRARWSNPKGLFSLGAVMMVGLTVSFVSLGTENVATRMESFLPGADNRFAATNDDHVNDMIDAWNVITVEPLLGYGIGRPYPTELIAEWKTDSFEVHNSVLHVWLKYGLLGMVAYLGFHLGWIRRLWGTLGLQGAVVPSLAGLAIFLASEFVATLIGTWPYGSTHLSVFHGVLLGFTALASVRPTQARLPAREGVGLP